MEKIVLNLDNNNKVDLIKEVMEATEEVVEVDLEEEIEVDLEVEIEEEIEVEIEVDLEVEDSELVNKIM